jgi:methyltransferase (TIGR00027 family)
MLPRQPSRTLLGSAIRRGQHQLLDSPLVFHDPVIVDMVPEAADPGVLPDLGPYDAIVPTLHRALMAMRARFTEDCLTQAAQRGARQYVIIGAGLDTFPWRQPDFARGMQIFAVDHPASLIWTQQRCRERGMAKPPNLIHVPVDLESQSLGEHLDACGFDREAISFCSVLGVIHYLNFESTVSMLRFAATLRAGSELVVSFLVSADELNGSDLDAFVRGQARAESLGEPWKFRQRPAEFAGLLGQLGFRHVFHLTPELANERYFKGRRDALRAPHWEQLVAATV